MLKNCVPAPRAALVQYRVLPCAHTRAALVRIRPGRTDALIQSDGHTGSSHERTGGEHGGTAQAP